MKIVADNKIPYLQGILEQYFDEVVYASGSSIKPSDVNDADALLIRTRTKCNKLLLENSKVKYIATATIGHDHIDKEFCSEKGVAWTNAPGCNAFGVVQYVLSALSLISLNGYGTLNGKTLGIVGVGEVGKRLAVAVGGLGLKVLLNDPPRQRAEGGNGFVSLDELVERSDIITFHVPLIREGDDKTLEMADASFFSKFTSPKVFINASRGEVVNDLVLIDAMKRGVVSNAVLDVWNGEPDLNQELMGIADIATPHIAGYSLEGKANGTEMSVNSILAFFFGGNVPAWKPTGLPEVPSVIAFNRKIDEEEAILRCILSTYNVKDDDSLLRANPDMFERIRGDYRIRREPSFFTVTGVDNTDVAEKLRRLTFKVFENE